MKKKSFSWPSFLMGVLAAIVCFAAAGAAGMLLLIRSEAKRPDDAAMFLKISAMQQVIRNRCLHEFSEEEQMNAMLRGMVSALDDPYAAYYTKEEYESIRRSSKGYKQGIGVTILEAEDGSLVINSVLEGYPAEAAGLQEGDVILEIDGEDMTGKTSAEAAALIQNSPNPEVTLLVRRARKDVSAASAADAADNTAADSAENSAADSAENSAADSSENGVLILQEPDSEELTIVVEKGELEITSVDGGMLSDIVSGEQLQALEKTAAGESGPALSEIGYIAITRFNGTTSDQFKNLYADLKEQGMKALIIDLRENLGGIVEGCCNTLRQILPEGVIVYERDRDGEERSRDCEGETPIDIPLVLLVNGHTASAAEIFAGAVQDYGIGTLVGTQTYGKGVEQNSYTFTDGSVLKLTTTNYFTPDHHDLNEIGITPDIVIEQTEEDTTDLQAERAVEVLRGGEP